MTTTDDRDPSDQKKTADERLAWLQAELDRSVQRIDEIEAARTELQQRLTTADSELDEVRGQLERVRSQLTDREDLVASQTRVNNWLETERTRLEEGLRTWERQAKALESHHEAERARLEEGLQAWEGQAHALEIHRDQLVAERQALEMNFERALASFRARETELTATLESLTSDRDRHAQLLDGLQSELEEARQLGRTREAGLNATIAQSESARASLEARLALIEGSNSWKLTAPVRALRRVVSRRRSTALAAGPTDPPEPRLPASASPDQELSVPDAPMMPPDVPAQRPSIVVVSHDAHFYGAQRVALFLSRTLSGVMGYDVEVLLCGPGPLMTEFAEVGRVHDFYSETSSPDAQARVIRDLYTGGARIAICNTSCVGHVVHALKDAGFAVVSLIHEMPGLIGQYGLEDSIATIARDADKVVFGASVVRDRFAELTDLALDKAVVRPQGLLNRNRYSGRRDEARQELRARLGLEAGKKIVLAVGSAHRRKGPDLFVATGLAVMERREDVVFVWVGHTDGDGFNDAWALVAEAGASARFFFPGVIEDSDVFFAGADVYLMTSREDPFPSVVLHALDAELPVIGFDGAGGFVELLQRDCGILVPYLDTNAMATATLELLADPSKGRRLSAAGKEIVSREFEFTEYVHELVMLAQGPRVSVIVPNYNYAHYLPARLRSVSTQTYRPCEILFLDDCSSDRSLEVAEQLLGHRGIPFRVIKNDNNQGVYRQWLRGLQEATGDLVWIAEADDDCSPLLLEKLVMAIVRPDVVLAYCQSKQIDDKGCEIAPDYLAWTDDVDRTKWRQGYVRRGIDEIRDSLAIKNTIPNVSAVLMRKPNLDEIASELVTLRHAGDWLVYVHVLEAGDLAFVPDPLNYHRRHAASVTIGHGGLNLMRETLLVQRHVLDRHSVPPDVERKREAHLQTTYDYLGLSTSGPASYRDHEALRPLALAAG